MSRILAIVVRPEVLPKQAGRTRVDAHHQQSKHVRAR
jgi:hypothetical protein